MFMLDRKKVVVGMSGGVDSTVAAKLLKDRGYQVIGVSLKLFNDPYNDSNYEEDFKVLGDDAGFDDARRVCKNLGIEHYVISLKSSFKKHVIDYFVNEYKKGRTPNPCVVCNKYIKFGDLFKIADSFGAYFVATGHYIRIEEDHGIYKVKMAESEEKDQTYMMYNLNQDIIKRLIMPLGHIEDKNKVRQLAEEFDVKISKKTDSQEICFVPGDDYIEFLKANFGFKDEKGKYFDASGNEIGKHGGIFNYTIGQRKGLGMSFGKPMFVLSINESDNSIILGDNEDLFTDGLIAEECNFIYNSDFESVESIKCKIRYSSKLMDCKIIKISSEKVKVVFSEKQRAVTPGQSVVFYDGKYLFGGGIIEKSL